MKVAVAVVMTVITLSLTGCVSFLSPDKPGYEAGRIAAVTYMVTEGVQPTEIRLACVTGYKVLDTVFTSTNLVSTTMDAAATQAIDKQMPGATPQVKQLAFNVYKMGKSRVEVALADNVKLKAPEYIGNFKQGVDSALKDYGYTK